MKIVYCINSIQEIGGISRVVKTKANTLAEMGHEIYIVVSDLDPSVPVDISDKVLVEDLKVRYYEDDWKSKLHILKGILIKRRIHKKRVTQFLNKTMPDIVISVGQCEKYFIPEIKGPWKTIREFHYDKNYRPRGSNSLINKILSKIINLYDYHYKIKRYDKIVVLTDFDKKINWRNNSKVVVIPNPTSDDWFKSSNLENNNIIAVGRLVKVKNFSSLINAFRIVVNKHPTWRLFIYGEGELKTQLQELINEKDLSTNVFLKGNYSAITEVMDKFSMFVMTSLYEGMPVAMLQAMSCGLPVISYDCPYGPRSIIRDGENGYLVPLNDETMLAKKINDLIENYDRRKEMGNQALIYAKSQRSEIICLKWINLFKNLLIL